jgi:hypothetical protein
VQDPKVKWITPSQTVGPFFAYGLTSNGKYDWNDAFSNNLVTADTSGERLRIEGRVFDGDGQPVPDCMLEIWQADAQGRLSDPKDKRALPNSAFRGFGRCGTDANGDYSFDTIAGYAVSPLNYESGGSGVRISSGAPLRAACGRDATSCLHSNARRLRGSGKSLPWAEALPSGRSRTGRPYAVDSSAQPSSSAGVLP